MNVLTRKLALMGFAYLCLVLGGVLGCYAGMLHMGFGSTSEILPCSIGSLMFLGVAFFVLAFVVKRPVTELVISVVLLGLIGGYISHVVRSGFAQRLVVNANVDVLQMSESAREHLEQGGTIHQHAQWTPTEMCCEPLCEVSDVSATWPQDPWGIVGFQPRYYRYQYRVVIQNDVLTFESRGDLDCDGELSLISQSVQKVGGTWRVQKLQTDDELE